MASLFSPKLPNIEPPAPMPDEDDPEIRAAKRRRVALAQQSSGVRSAVLSQPGGKETLGG